jgi:hypothetical protein
MFNQQILDHLIEKYGKEKTTLFCEMESERNALLYNEVEKDNRHYPEPNEWQFERDWWAESGKQLKQR